MVKVIFYNLLRSKYGIKETTVKSGSIHYIVEQILNKYENMKLSDFKSSVVFYKGTPVHYLGFHKVIDEGEEIIFTHFVGGG
jgi:molybdopterin converting factor small subunit